MTLYSDPQYLPYTDPLLWAVGGGLYIIGAIIYMLRIPERWAPERFDFFGASH